MAKLRVHNIAVSLDGFCAGPDQRLDQPLGVGGEQLHEWMFATRYWAEMAGRDDAASVPGSIDDEILRRGDENVGATIMGRNMFGPVRGGWETWDGDWNGWWGPKPPYGHDVFVLTHHERPAAAMDGGTTFHFVTDGIEAALASAFEAADGADVRVAGGARAVQQYLRAGLVDHVHYVIAPILLGRGERLLDDLGDATEGYRCTEVRATDAVTHVTLERDGT